MYDPTKVFEFTHHYELSDNYLCVNWFGRDLTEKEKQKVIKDNEGRLAGSAKGAYSSTALGILPPLDDVSGGGELK